MALDEDKIFQIWQIENSYMQALRNARIAARNEILGEFRRLDNWRDENIAQWKNRAATIQENANIVAGRLTISKQAASRRVWGVEPSANLNVEAVSVRALRPGLEPTEPWQKVANEMYYNLSIEKPVTRTVEIAESRIDAVSKSIFQEATASADSQNATPRLTGYMRVLSGSTKHCERCLLASSRVYRARTATGAPNLLRPIHDRCTCIRREIYDYAVTDDGDFSAVLAFQQNLSPEERDWLIQNTVRGNNTLDEYEDDDDDFDLEAYYAWAENN